MKNNILFLENFAACLAQGYNVEQSLTLTHQIFRFSFYNHYINALSQGEDIYDLLLEGDFPVTFKNYLSFYKSKACLSDAIMKSLEIYTKQYEFMNQIKKQLSYPLFLMFFLFLFSLFILFFLLPQIDLLFNSFDIKMNIFTYLIFYCFRLFPLLFIFVSIMIYISIFCLLYGIKNKKHRIIDFFIRDFIVGTILKKYFSLKFALFYNELLLDFVDTSTIIETLNEKMCDDDIKIILYEIKRLLSLGEDIEGALKQIKYFDPLLISFFEINFYNINKKDALVFYINTTYKQIENVVNKFIKIIIPVVYCFVSFFVIGVYIAIIIPLMSGFSNI